VSRLSSFSHAAGWALCSGGAPPVAREMHCCTMIKHYLVVAGGVDGSQRFHDIHVLDTTRMVSVRRWSRRETKAPRRFDRSAGHPHPRVSPHHSHSARFGCPRA
jgi:hypothetical protein